MVRKSKTKFWTTITRCLAKRSKGRMLNLGRIFLQEKNTEQKNISLGLYAFLNPRDLKKEKGK